MSTPRAFMGEAAGRNTRGLKSVTFEEEGKAMTREGSMVAFTDTVSLQERDVLKGPRAEEAEQVPAFEMVVSGALQH